MRLILLLLAFLLVLARLVAADQIVNNRGLGSPGDAQYAPSLALTHSASGDHLVCVWEQQDFAGTVRDFRLAVSTSPHGNYSWVEYGSPPAPAGYSWLGDVQVEAPGLGQDTQGTFLIFGQVRSVSGPPNTYGMASVRGHAQDANTLSYETPVLIQTFGSQSVPSRYVGALSLTADPNSSTVFIGYVNALTDVGSLYTGTWFRRSTNFGTTWSAPISTSVDSSEFASVPALQPGPDGGVAMLYSVDQGDGYRQVQCKLSGDGGLSFGGISIATNGVFSTMSSPFGAQLWPGALSTTAAFIGPRAGATYFAEGREMTHGSLTFPNPATSPAVIENEPNRPWPLANPVFTLGAVIRGMTGGTAPADTDWYAFPLAQGQTVVLLCDSVAASLVSVELRWYGPDGKSLLSRWFTQMEFTAPAAGTYLLQVVRNSGSTGGYRIRTMGAAPLAGDPRDQRDLFLFEFGPIGWSAPINVSASVLPAGYDEDGPSMHVNRDGYLYMTWQDWSAMPGRMIGRHAIARSPDGGATWEGPVFLNTANSDWGLALAPNVGGLRISHWGDMASDLTSYHCVWVDARNGDADLYSRSVDRDVQITQIAPSSNASPPGDLVSLNVNMNNLDDVWSWNSFEIHAESTRGWNIAPAIAGLDPGELGHYPFEFSVPDTATPGTVGITISLRSTITGLTYSSAPTTLTVTSNVGVDAEVPHLELGPVTPNPASRVAHLAYSLSRPGPVRLSVYDVGGRLVARLEDGDRMPGSHRLGWSGTDSGGARVPSGAYLLRLEAEGKTITRRMAWIR